MDRYGIDIQRIVIGQEPVIVDDVKPLVGVDFDDDDATIERLCTAARLEAERFCGRCFVSSTVKVYAEYWEGSYEIPYGPVSAITSVKNGNEEDITDYKLKGYDFKKLEVTAEDGLYLEFTSNVAECPEDAKTAIALLAAVVYDADFADRFKADAYRLLTQFKRQL